eukprot:scaffold3234_cov166-Amphora_coffeaeformis.AAC.6
MSKTRIPVALDITNLYASNPAGPSTSSPEIRRIKAVRKTFSLIVRLFFLDSVDNKDSKNLCYLDHHQMACKWREMLFWPTRNLAPSADRKWYANRWGLFSWKVGKTFQMDSRCLVGPVRRKRFDPSLVCNQSHGHGCWVLESFGILPSR